MEASPLSVTAARDGHSCVLTISGDLELTTAGMFPQMMCQAVSSLDGHDEQIVLDLSGLAFLDVAGARTLVAAVHVIRDGHTIKVGSISPAASRVLGVLGWVL